MFQQSFEAKQSKAKQTSPLLARGALAIALGLALVATGGIAAHAASTSVTGMVTSPASYTQYVMVRTNTQSTISLDPSILLYQSAFTNQLKVKLLNENGSDLTLPKTWTNSYASQTFVSGLAPGRFALTCIVGKSTVGRSLTGSNR